VANNVELGIQENQLMTPAMELETDKSASSQANVITLRPFEPELPGWYCP
jgi:hypothetical protein